MRALEFGRSDRFLVPSVDLLKESTVVTRDIQYSLFRNMGQEKKDLFLAKWYDDSCEPTNFYDLVDNLMAYWSCITNEMYDKSQTWGSSFRECEELKYSEGNDEFETLIDARIPSLASSGYRNPFLRQVSGNYIPICRFMSMCEDEDINAPKEIKRIWDIWLAGFFPCGFDGIWPASGKFIVYEPN